MNSIDIAILGFLYEKEMHGYEIYKLVSEKNGMGAIYSLKIGRLYTILNKLEESGYIQSELDANGPRPPKKNYTITSDGKKLFKNWLKAPVKHGRDIRINLLMKLFFAKKSPMIDEKDILMNQIQECHDWMERITQEISNLQNEGNIQFVVKQFRKSQIEGYINWLTWCKRRINND